MGRRKSEITARMNERDYPHLVELPLPSAGFQSISDDIVAFHRKRDKIRRRRWRYNEGQFFVTFGFGDPARADAFRNRFGGERLVVRKHRDDEHPSASLR